MIDLPPNTTISYQRDLAAFVVENKLHTLVETGLGVSSVFLLDALDQMGAGHLTSCDPSPWYAGKIDHPRHTHIAELSSECLWRIGGPWDLMLHDGDHDILSQTLDIHFGWGMLREGGWLACDDYGWGQHNAWQDFLDLHKLTPVQMGAVQMVQKTHRPIRAESVPTFFCMCLSEAEQAEAKWLAGGGENSEAFAQHRRR